MCISVGNPAKVIRKRDEQALKYKLGHRVWFR